MSLSHASGPDDAKLVRYLLGLLSNEEAERIDELTIADDDVAWRVRGTENELVDAYVRGGLDGEILEQFETYYLSSPLRLEKVMFARSFLRNADVAPAPEHTEPAPVAASAPVPRRIRSASRGSRWFERLLPQTRLSWSLAATAATLLLASGVLLSQDVRQRRHSLQEAQTAKATLDHRAQELERQLDDQRSTNADTAKELASVRDAIAALAQRGQVGQASQSTGQSGSSSRSLTTVALVLWPQTRAAGSIPTVTVPPGTDRVALALRIESNDFPGYQAVLRDPATDRVVWRSGSLAARSAGELTVPVVVPASLLKPQHYSLELLARGVTVNAEVVGSYAFRIVQH
jgi:hypothetical protein